MATNIKKKISGELVKFSKGQKINYGDMKAATLKDFEDALIESNVDFDSDQLLETSRLFLLAKYEYTY